MPVLSAASWLGRYDLTNVAYGIVGCTVLWSIKHWLGGKKNTRERDWAGKMILIVAEANSTTYSLLDTLLNLPRPPQILFLPPLTSPMPEDVLTMLHTIRLSATNPLAQLHCEPLPRTPEAVAAFTHKWSTPMKGTVSESGRRIDAIILGAGWEIGPPTPKADGAWTVHQHHYHLLTSLLPALLRAPAERSIRVVSLVSPAWAAAIPTIQGKTVSDTPVTLSAQRGLTSLLVMRHFQLILDTLASATYSKTKPVPDPNHPNATVKTREEGLKSNIMAMSVIMPWTRGEGVRGAMGADDGWLSFAFYVLAYPILLLTTPSPTRAIQSILYALSAPVRYADVEPPTHSKGKPAKPAAASSEADGVAGGDIIRGCAVTQLPPALQDSALAKANYEALEREVEERIKKSTARSAAGATAG